MSMTAPLSAEQMRKEFPQHIRSRTYLEWVAFFISNHGVSFANAEKYAKCCVDTFGVPGEEEQGTNEFGEVCP